MNHQQIVKLATEAIRGSHVFRGLPDDLLRKLVQHARYEEYTQQTLLVEPGKKWDYLYYVIDGYFVAKAHSKSGKQAQAAPVQAGIWMYWGALFSPSGSRSEIWSAENTRLITLPRERILELAEQWPQLYPQVIEELNRVIGLLHNWIYFSNLLRGDKRTGAQLLYQNSVNPATDQTQLIFTQSQLARSLGISRQTLSEHFRSLEDKGFIEHGYGWVTIIDVEGLQEYTSI
jgi:CRP/FNR family cyclic AMP-dependent transcriptional regulator